MEGFQNIVLFSAIIILIIVLVIIGVVLVSVKSSETWPPMVPECPDYWGITGLDISGNNMAKCVNIKDLGRCPANSGDEHLIMDFNSPMFTGDNGTCAKYAWAKKCDVTWDGITYGVNNPCQTTA